MTRPTLLWFRVDLRLADNPALQAARERGGAIIPAFVWAPEEEAPWQPGAASRWWLHQSLAALDSHLRQLGSRLILRRGPTLEALRSLQKETGAAAVFWNRRYEPGARRRDQIIADALQGIEVKDFNAALLHDPQTVQNQSGKPFQVFTPFWRHCLAQGGPRPPAPAPHRLPAPRTWPKSLALAELELEPKLNWAAGLSSAWRPGEASAQAMLSRFIREAHAQYDQTRNRPDLPGTSRLSPHLHFGELSPRQIWHALETAGSTRLPTATAIHPSARPLEKRTGEKNSVSPGTLRPSSAARHPLAGGQFLAEIGWREFAHHLLHHFPHTPEAPLRESFARFPWRHHEAWLEAWQQGRTGYPLVDAGLRELWATGWMHNRVRMVAASFLVKHLQIPWTDGAHWFWDTLVDADLASNTLGWQWTAGCGADAAPYFRIFNPVSQGEKFDPHGDYVRHWAPELARLPQAWIQQPWKAPPEVLARARIKLGADYPMPLVSHFSAREAALEAYARFRNPA